MFWVFFSNWARIFPLVFGSILLKIKSTRRPLQPTPENSQYSVSLFFFPSTSLFHSLLQLPSIMQHPSIMIEASFPKPFLFRCKFSFHVFWRPSRLGFPISLFLPFQQTPRSANTAPTRLIAIRFFQFIYAASLPVHRFTVLSNIFRSYRFIFLFFCLWFWFCLRSIVRSFLRRLVFCF